MYDKIHNYIYQRKDEIVNLLGEMVAIPSVKGDPIANAPFGKNCAKMLDFCEKLYKDNGFDTEMYQNDGYMLAHYGDGKEKIGLYAHGDVVPVGDDWLFTEPFKMIDRDGIRDRKQR